MGMSVTIGGATAQDAEQILKLQYLCYQSEAALSGDYQIAPLTQPLAGLRGEVADGCVMVARLGTEVVGSVRATVDADGTACIGRLIVHPRMRRHGLGRRLLAAIEQRLEQERSARRYRLFTPHRSDGKLRLYHALGYAPVATERVSARITLVTLEKEGAQRPVATSA